MSCADILRDPNVVDFEQGLTPEQMARIYPVDIVSSELIHTATRAFKHQGQAEAVGSGPEAVPTACTVYEHRDFDGLKLFPSLFPPECQVLLVDRLLHRELSNSLHETNLHRDYHFPFPADSPASFFSYPQSAEGLNFVPRDPLSGLAPLNNAQFLQKKLRWLTIGDQYDWDTRTYPESSPTAFPADVAGLVKALFRDCFTPESGVVLMYSPKDYMPVHRDVSEACRRDLVSISLGCDGIFMVARRRHHDRSLDAVDHGPDLDVDQDMDQVVIRVRSGDVVQMGGSTRWAWHAMPKVLAGTCPVWLQEWPCLGVTREPDMYKRWRGYMRGKRLNLSCRQVWG